MLLYSPLCNAYTLKSYLNHIHFISLEILFGCDMVSHNILEEVRDMSQGLCLNGDTW
jgi:hypothetical protein